MPNALEITPGDKINKLAFVDEAGYVTSSTGRSRYRMGRFVCECGNEVVVAIRHWTAGSSRSCGCAKIGRPTHGMSGTPIHSAWKGMRARTTPGTVASRNYGGVKRDQRWETFEGFLANQPAGRPFEPGLQLARTADVGDYSPENTRWATRSENAIESRLRAMYRTSDGELAAPIARRNGIKPGTWHHRVRVGWTVDDAVTVPVKVA